MKKMFLQNRGVRTTRRLQRGLLIAVIFAFFFLFLFWQRIFFSDLIYTLTTPLVRSWQWVGGNLSHLRVYILSKDSLESENRILKDTLAQRDVELTLLRSLYPDIEVIKNYFSQGESQDILATVVLAPPLSPYDVLVLDKGARDQVSVGDMVRTSERVVLGTIAEVFKNFSRVALFSSPGTKVAVRIGEETVQAEAVGVGGGEFQLLLPREFEITQGDVIFAPDVMSGTFGTVQSVEFQDADFLQVVSFRVPVNLSSVRFVIIERKNHE